MRECIRLVAKPDSAGELSRFLIDLALTPHMGSYVSRETEKEAEEITPAGMT